MPSFSLRISVIMLSKVEAYCVPYFACWFPFGRGINYITYVSHSVCVTYRCYYEYTYISQVYVIHFGKRAFYLVFYLLGLLLTIMSPFRRTPHSLTLLLCFFSSLFLAATSVSSNTVFLRVCFRLVLYFHAWHILETISIDG
jgi:hypothetical protein